MMATLVSALTMIVLSMGNTSAGPIVAPLAGKVGDRLTFDQGGKFKILSLSDMHFGECNGEYNQLNLTAFSSFRLHFMVEVLLMNLWRLIIADGSAAAWGPEHVSVRLCLYKGTAEMSVLTSRISRLNGCTGLCSIKKNQTLCE